MTKSSTTQTRRSAWHEYFPLKTGNRWLDLLLAAVPAAIGLHYAAPSAALLTFFVTAVAIIPLAGALGEATEELGSHLGDRAGGLLNATMGNATELILSFFALRAGHVEIVKASISGSIIGNVLLVLGLSALIGGIGREHQQFSRRHATISGTMLFVAVVALVVPAVFDLAVYGQLRQTGYRVEQLSLWTCFVLVIVYGLSLVFAFQKRPGQASATKSEHTASAKSALISLVLATILVAFLSEILVGTIDSAKSGLGMSDLFLGVIIIAVIGNAAEHATAMVMARRDRMELAISIAIGSSIQIALLVAPILVFVSWLIGRPMSLVFTPLEIAGIAVAVITADMISSDGETTWFEGVLLIAVYVILAVAFYFVPAVHT